MSFKFFITAVHELPTARKVVVDGLLLDGIVGIGNKAHIQEGDSQQQLVVEGVTMFGFAKLGNDRMSLTLSRNDVLAAGIRHGQTIISAD